MISRALPLGGIVILGAVPALFADQGTAPLLVLAGVAALVGSVGVAARLSGLIVLALAMVGAEYALALRLGGTALDESVPAFGVALLVVAELSFAAIEPTAGNPVERGVARRRAVGIATLALLGLAASGVAWGAAQLRPGDGAVIALSGIVGVTLVLGCVAWIAARAGGRHRTGQWPSRSSKYEFESK